MRLPFKYLLNSYRRDIAEFIGQKPSENNPAQNESDWFLPNLTTQKIEEFVNNYKRLIEVFKSLSKDEADEVRSFYNQKLEEISEYKKSLQFEEKGRTDLFNGLVDEFNENMIQHVDKKSRERLSTLLYSNDPWGSMQPRNDDEYEHQIHWWSKIENAKIDRLYHAVFKSKYPGADKLSQANEWLPALVKKIGQLQDPTKENIIGVICGYFPDFNIDEFDPHIKLTWGAGINKSGIDTVLTYLFNTKHKTKIKNGAIKSRANTRKWW